MTDLLEFFEKVYEKIDHGKLKDVYVIYLDFTKEFQKVSHNRLTKELQTYGIGGSY